MRHCFLETRRAARLEEHHCVLHRNLYICGRNIRDFTGGGAAADSRGCARRAARGTCSTARAGGGRRADRIVYTHKAAHAAAGAAHDTAGAVLRGGTDASEGLYRHRESADRTAFRPAGHILKPHGGGGTAGRGIRGFAHRRRGDRYGKTARDPVCHSCGASCALRHGAGWREPCAGRDEHESGGLYCTKCPGGRLWRSRGQHTDG